MLTKDQSKPILIALCGVALHFYLLFPGIYGYDSLLAIEEYRTAGIGDWFPPVFTYLLGRTDDLFGNQSGLFLVALALMWCGLVGYLYPLIRKVRAALLVLSIFLLTPFWLAPVYVDKNSFMMAAFCFATGMFALATDNRSWPLWPGFIGILLASVARHNAFFAAFPFFVWFVYILQQRRSTPNRGLKTLLVPAVAIHVGVLLSVAVSKAYILNRRSMHPTQMVMIYDLAGISVNSGRYLFPRFMDRGRKNPPDLEGIRRLYSPSIDLPLYWNSPRAPGTVKDEGEYVALKTAWLNAIRDYPWAYLTHRLNVFWKFLCSPEPPFWRLRQERRSAGSPYASRPFVLKSMEAVESGPLGKVGVYLVLQTLFLIAALVLPLRSSPAFYTLSLSAILYLLSYFFIVPRAAFSYGLWGCLAVLLAGCSIKWERLIQTLLLGGKSLSNQITRRIRRCDPAFFRTQRCGSSVIPRSKADGRGKIPLSAPRALRDS